MNLLLSITVCVGCGVQEAAAVTLSYTVAHLLVHDLANITSNHTVLVHSAGGAVVSVADLACIVCVFIYDDESPCCCGTKLLISHNE